MLYGHDGKSGLECRCDDAPQVFIFDSGLPDLDG